MKKTGEAIGGGKRGPEVMERAVRAVACGLNMAEAAKRFDVEYPALYYQVGKAKKKGMFDHYVNGGEADREGPLGGYTISGEAQRLAGDAAPPATRKLDGKSSPFLGHSVRMDEKPLPAGAVVEVVPAGEGAVAAVDPQYIFGARTSMDHTSRRRTETMTEKEKAPETGSVVEEPVAANGLTGGAIALLRGCRLIDSYRVGDATLMMFLDDRERDCVSQLRVLSVGGGVMELLGPVEPLHGRPVGSENERLEEATDGEH